MRARRVEGWTVRTAAMRDALPLPRPRLWLDGDGDGRAVVHVGVFFAAQTMDPCADVGVSLRARPGSLIFRLICWMDRRGAERW